MDYQEGNFHTVISGSRPRQTNLSNKATTADFNAEREALGLQGERRAEFDRVATDHFDCDLCGRTLSADDLSSGLAVHNQGKSYCLTCVRKLQNLASGAFQAPPSPGGETPRDNLDDSEIDLLLKEEGVDSEDSDLF